MRAFARQFVQHALAEPKEELAEAPPFDALPRRPTVRSAAPGVDHRTGMLQQPGGDGVSNGKIFAEAGFQAQL